MTSQSRESGSAWVVPFPYQNPRNFYLRHPSAAVSPRASFSNLRDDACFGAGSSGDTRVSKLVGIRVSGGAELFTRPRAKRNRTDERGSMRICLNSHVGTRRDVTASGASRVSTWLRQSSCTSACMFTKNGLPFLTEIGWHSSPRRARARGARVATETHARMPLRARCGLRNARPCAASHVPREVLSPLLFPSRFFLLRKLKLHQCTLHNNEPTGCRNWVPHWARPLWRNNSSSVSALLLSAEKKKFGNAERIKC